MERLRAEGLQEIEGVEIRVARSDPQDYLITSEHVHGDLVYSVGNDGRIMRQEGSLVNQEMPGKIRMNEKRKFRHGEDSR